MCVHIESSLFPYCVREGETPMFLLPSPCDILIHDGQIITLDRERRICRATTGVSQLDI